MTLVIGLTGSIATGKSTVSKMLQALNIPVVDADEIAKEVVKPGEDAYKEIIKSFGEEIILQDGTIDRKKLGSIVFTNEEERQKLNKIVHPAVRKRMLEERDNYIAKGFKAVVLDIPLLFESKLTHFVDKTLVVYVDRNVQMERLMHRDKSSEKEATQRIKSQIPVEKKIEMADAVINNNGPIEDTQKQVILQLKNWNVL